MPEPDSGPSCIERGVPAAAGQATEVPPAARTSAHGAPAPFLAPTEDDKADRGSATTNAVAERVTGSGASGTGR